jgi:hypothetical protein
MLLIRIPDEKSIFVHPVIRYEIVIIPHLEIMSIRIHEIFIFYENPLSVMLVSRGYNLVWPETSVAGY